MSAYEGSKDHDERFYQLVADYLEAAESGESPDETAILAGRADLATDLADFVASLQVVERHIAPIRGAIDIPEVHQFPKAFGDFELLNEIGRGGMGVVYRARQISLNRIVALKMIRSRIFDKESNARRFRSEAEAAASLDHPGIVPIYEIGEYDEHPYFSMKLLEGGNLGEHVAELKSNPYRAAELIVVLARAVHHAHERGILHRDLKPSNILLDNEGRPHVADFGLAKWVDSEDNLTETGAVVGTPAYMPPELAAPSTAANRREAVTTAGDIYGLGAVLFAALTGAPPFAGATPIETLSAVCQREPPDPSHLNPLIDRDLATICIKCLQKKPQHRYSSAANLADDLERWRRGLPILARPIGNRERLWRWCGRNRLLALLTGSAALLLIVSVVALASGYVLVNRARETAEEHRFDAEQKANSLRQRVYASQMTRGMKHWERGEYDELGPLLAEFTDYSELQGFEYRWLNAEFQRRPRELIRYTGHEGIVYDAALSPDGRTVATCGEDRSIQLWDVETGERRATYRPRPETAGLPVRPHKEDENRVCFSPDGRMLISGGEDGTIRQWDLANGGWRAFPARHQSDVLWIEFSRDGQRLLTAGADAVVRVWEPATLRLVGEFTSHVASVSGAVFSPDGRTIVSVDRAGVICGWDSATLELKFKQKLEEILLCVAIAPDGDWFVTGEGSGEIRKWNLRDGAPIGTPIKDVEQTQSLDISPDGTRLAVCGRDACVRIRSTANGDILHNFRAHDARMWRIRFLSGGQRLLTASADATAKIWEFPDSVRIQRWDTPGIPVIRHLTCAPRGTNFAFTTDTGVLALGDARLRLPPRALPVEVAKMTHPVFSPDGRELVFVGVDAAIRRWSLSEDREMEPFKTTDAIQDSPLFRPSDILLYYVGDNRLIGLRSDGQLWIRDDAHWKSLRLPTPNPASYRLVTPLADSRSLAIADAANSEILHWDLATERVVSESKRPAFTITACACFTDQRTAALADHYGNIRIIDLQTGHETTRMVGHSSSVDSFSVSPDGKTLATASGDGTARLWNLSTNEELFVLDSDAPPFGRAIAFSSDGRFLVVTKATLSRKSIVTVYDAGIASPAPANP